jgi:transcriptional regulator with XRE-family HTH domain
MAPIPRRQSDSKAQGVHALPSDLVAGNPESSCSSEALIGTHLRLLRRKQSLSIRALAAQCGISANTLSLIENGHTSPSVHTLELLARGLGVPLATFFEEEAEGPTLVYQQQGQRPRMQFAQGTLENLSEGLPPLGAEPILVTLNAGQAEAENISHAGREFIFCLEGNITVIVASQGYPLSPGDSLLFDASAPHRWSNPHAEAARLLVLFCPMEARDQPAERHLGR